MSEPSAQNLESIFLLHQQGHFNEAEAGYKSYLEQQPHHKRATFLLSALYCQSRRPDLALPLVNMLLAEDPKNVDALKILATIYQLKNDFEKARETYENVLDLDANQESAWINLGNILRNQKKYINALDCFLKANELNPKNDFVLSQVAHTHRNLGDLEAASNCFVRACKLNPNNRYALNGLGLCHKDLDEHDAAIKCFEEILQHEPRHFEALCNLALTHRTLGNLDAALDFYNQALVINPQSAEAHFNRGIVLMLKEDFETGWSEIEWRLKTPQHQFQLIYPQPRWQNEDLSNKSILIHGEQGIADEVLFANVLIDIEKMAKTCVIECDKRLKSVFERSFPQAQIHGRERWGDVSWLKEFPAVDFQIPSESLFQFVRPNPESFPKISGYLKASPDKTQDWKTRLDKLGKRKKIGLSWKSSGNFIHDQNPVVRAKAGLDIFTLLPLLNLKDCQFVCIQHGDHSNELQQLKDKHGIEINIPENLDLKDDLDGLAALLNALDMVIGIQSLPATLSAALGKPTWVFMNKEANFFYGLTRETPLIFPSMRLFRQSEFGRWDDVVERMVEKLC